MKNMDDNIKKFDGDLSEYLSDIICEVLNNAVDAKKYDDNSEFEQGRQLAYYETVNVIKNDLTIRGIKLKDIGFENERDLEKLY